MSPFVSYYLAKKITFHINNGVWIKIFEQSESAKKANFSFSSEAEATGLMIGIIEDDWGCAMGL